MGGCWVSRTEVEEEEEGSCVLWWCCDLAHRGDTTVYIDACEKRDGRQEEEEETFHLHTYCTNTKPWGGREATEASCQVVIHKKRRESSRVGREGKRRTHASHVCVCPIVEGTAKTRRKRRPLDHKRQSTDIECQQPPSTERRTRKWNVCVGGKCLFYVCAFHVSISPRQGTRVRAVVQYYSSSRSSRSLCFRVRVIIEDKM